uniref:uncharacterized protein n=1 Tax=Myxine glutinosa TaxID=7769 RepID=UPI00358E3AC8
MHHWAKGTWVVLNYLACLTPPWCTSIEMRYSGPGTVQFIEEAGPVKVLPGKLTIHAEPGTLECVQVTILNPMDKTFENLKLATLTAPEVTSISSEKLSDVLRVSGLDASATYAAAMASLTYDNHKHNPNPTDRIINIRSLHTDKSRSTGAELNITVWIKSVNHSPFFDHGPLHVLYTVENANKWSQIPHTVLALFGSLINDTDDGDQLGVAIIGADNSNGQWEFLTWPGVWKAVPDGIRGHDGQRRSNLVHQSPALRATWSNFIRFLPAPHFHGNSSLDAVAWDCTGPTAFVSDGALVNATHVDSSSPFSSQSITITMSVLPINDAPKVSLEPVHLMPILEDSLAPPGSSIMLILETCRDVDVLKPNASLGLAITGTDRDHGRWEFSTDGALSWFKPNPSPSLSDALLLGKVGENDLFFARFVPRPHFLGQATIRFKAWDFTDGRKAGARGVDVGTYTPYGAYSQREGTAWVEVMPINHSPVISADHVTLGAMTEGSDGGGGTQLRSLLWGLWADPDTSDDLGVAIVAMENKGGTWQFTCDSSRDQGSRHWTSITSVSFASAILLVENCILRFAPAPLFNTEKDLNGRTRSLVEKPWLGLLAWDNTGLTRSRSGQKGVNIIHFNTSKHTEFGKHIVKAYIEVRSVNNEPVIILSQSLTPSVYYINHGAVPLFFEDLMLFDADGKFIKAIVAQIRYKHSSDTQTWDCQSDTSSSSETLSVHSLTPMLSLRVISYCPFGIEMTTDEEDSGQHNIEEFQHLISTLHYNNTAVNPSRAERTVSLKVWDGEHWSKWMDIPIRLQSLAPVKITPEDIITSKKPQDLPTFNITLTEASEIERNICKELSTLLSNVEPHQICFLTEGVNLTRITYNIYTGTIRVRALSQRYGFEQLFYLVNNGHHSYGLLRIHILHVNQPPKCENRDFETREATMLAIDLSESISDVDHPQWELQLGLVGADGAHLRRNVTLEQGSNAFILESKKTIRFLPAEGFVGLQRVIYTVCDPCATTSDVIPRSMIDPSCLREAEEAQKRGAGRKMGSNVKPGCGTGTLDIHVLNVNNPPIIKSMSGTTLTGKSILFQPFHQLRHNHSALRLSTADMVAYDPDDVQTFALIGCGLNPTDYGLSRWSDLDLLSVIITEAPNLGIANVHRGEERIPQMRYTARPGNTGYDWFSYQLCDLAAGLEQRACGIGSIFIHVTQRAPTIIQATAHPALHEADGSRKHTDCKLSRGDTLMINFDSATNMPPLHNRGQIVSKFEVDQMFDLSDCWESDAFNYIGTWLSPKRFIITIVNEITTSQSSNQVAKCIIMVRKDVGPCGGFINGGPIPLAQWSRYCLTSAAMDSPHAAGKSSFVSGSWGLTLPRVVAVVIQNDKVPVSLLARSGLKYLGHFSQVSIRLKPPLSHTQLQKLCMAELHKVLNKTSVLLTGFKFVKINCTETFRPASSVAENVHLDSQALLQGQRSALAEKTLALISEHLENYKENILPSAVSTDITLAIDAEMGHLTDMSRNRELLKDILSERFLSNLVAKDCGVTETQLNESNELQVMHDNIEFYFAHLADATPRVTQITVNSIPAPVNHQFTKGDVIKIKFDRDTDMPTVLLKEDIDKVLHFAATIGQEYTGRWTNKRTLEVTITREILSDEVMDITMSLSENDYSQYPPTLSSDQLNCVGIRVCGDAAGLKSIGVCDVRQLSCRARGSFLLSRGFAVSKVVANEQWPFAIVGLIVGLILNALVILCFTCWRLHGKKKRQQSWSHAESEDPSNCPGHSPHVPSPQAAERRPDVHLLAPTCGPFETTRDKSDKPTECAIVNLRIEDPPNVHRTLLKHLEKT